MSDTMSTAKNTPADAPDIDKPPIQRAVEHERKQRTETGEHVRLGLDKTGAIHHLAEHESRIIVIKSGEIQHVERFADHSNPDLVVTEWLEYIENGNPHTDFDGRGWCEREKYITQHEFEDLTEGLQTVKTLLEGRL